MSFAASLAFLDEKQNLSFNYLFSNAHEDINLDLGLRESTNIPSRLKNSEFSWTPSMNIYWI